MNDRKDAVLRGRPAGPDRQQADEGSFTYHYARYEGGQHWFSAEHDGDEVGHAHVIEQRGPGGPHAEIRRLRTNPQYRGRGIGSRLLDNVAEHFEGHELRLKPYPTGEDGDPDEDDLREYYGSRGFRDYQLKDGDRFELHDYMTKPGSPGRQEEARHRVPGGRGGRRSQAARPFYLHGGPNRVEPGGFIHQDAMPLSHGRARHNFFTASREIAEDAADMRDGLGHGWIHVVEPAGDFEVDCGEPESWKSEAPLRVVSVEPGQLNGETPHPPELRQQKGSAGSSAARGHLYHATPYPHGFPHDEWTHAGTRAAAQNRIARTNPADYGLPPGTPATLHTIRLRGRVYPHILSNQQIDEIWGAGHLDGLEQDGLPNGKGHHIFPYRNGTEDEGSTSYLVYRPAIVLVRTETIPRLEQHPHHAAGTYRAEQELFSRPSATPVIHPGKLPRCRSRPLASRRQLPSPAGRAGYHASPHPP
jgi:GNAT superfamily N-acetyltransferase